MARLLTGIYESALYERIPRNGPRSSANDGTAQRTVNLNKIRYTVRVRSGVSAHPYQVFRITP